jgi:predicted RNase H-like HicB family nuclease
MEVIMEQIVKLHIEKLPEGVYLATSDDVPGLVAQGRTVAETIEIARDVARVLMEVRASSAPVKNPVGDVLDVSVVIAA